MQIQRTKPDSTKQNEKCLKFDSVVQVLNLCNEVRFDGTKTDSTMGYLARRNKNLIFGVNSAS